jgi:hypothetical protein
MIEIGKIMPVESLAPAADAAGRTGTYMSMKDFTKVLIVCHITQGNAATIALTPYQASAVAATGEKVLTNNVNIWANQATDVSDTLVAQTAAKNFTTSAAVKNKIVVFEITANALDKNGGFDCITIKTGASNAANITQAMYVLGGARYPQATPPTALTD